MIFYFIFVALISLWNVTLRGKSEIYNLHYLYLYFPLHPVPFPPLEAAFRLVFAFSECGGNVVNKMVNHQCNLFYRRFFMLTLCIGDGRAISCADIFHSTGRTKLVAQRFFTFLMSIVFSSSFPDRCARAP